MFDIPFNQNRAVFDSDTCRCAGAGAGPFGQLSATQTGGPVLYGRVPGGGTADECLLLAAMDGADYPL